MQLTSDPRRADRERRYKPPPPTSAPAEDLTTDYMNILDMRTEGKNGGGSTPTHRSHQFYKEILMRLIEASGDQRVVQYFAQRISIAIQGGMVFSMCGLMMRLKWCAWTAVFCSSISFANSRVSDDTKQIVSSFMLSISAVVMSYLQNPQPMSPPWAALTT